MNSVDDPFNLARFLEAQEKTYDQALAELRARKKKTHWIWYVLPQLKGLGESPNSSYYGISSLDEAKAYLENQVLGQRLVDAVGVLFSLKGIKAEAVLGRDDAIKFRSCLTLFAQISNEGSIFHRGLDLYFAGSPDQKTLRILAQQHEQRRSGSR
jgi:uncharacterized protein (DUF1810 family)